LRSSVGHRTLVIPLDAIEDRDAGAVGAKALSLARMSRIGLPVPPGFCVTGGAYRDHLDRCDLLARLRGAVAALAAAPPGSRPDVLADIRQAIVAAPLCETLSEEIERHYRALGEARLAVRSSATAEDLPEHSFAGQHDTYLGVVGLSECLQAVGSCWASLWTERAVDYRTRNGLDHLDVAMGVIIQRLVPAEAAGVLFTADPVTGRSDRLIIEGCFGLGVALASGRVSPDRIVLSKRGRRILERAISSQSAEVVPDTKGGVREQALAPERAKQPCVDDATARRLGSLGLRVEKALGSPQDLEWAVAAGKLYILQSRPITGLPSEGSLEDRQVWTNANAGEVVPDVMTPMTGSVITPLVELLFDRLLSKLGIDIRGHRVFRLIAGRVYFNLNTFLGALRHIPVLRNRGFSELFGGRTATMAALDRIEISEDDIPDLKFSWLKVALRLPGAILGLITHSPKRGHRFLARMRQGGDALWRIDPRSLSEHQLVDRVQDIIDTLLGTPAGLDFVGIGVMYPMMFINICRRWFGESGDAIASRLFAGVGGMDHAEAGLELWRLAVLAHEHSGVERAILSGDSYEAVRERIAQAEGGNEFLARLAAFLSRHGHHTRGEIELLNPRWWEQPDYVLDTLCAYLRGIEKKDPIAQHRRRAEEGKRLAAQCRAQLRHPVKRLLFDFLLRQAQQASPIRENLKSEVVRRLALVRLMLLELGDRLARRGVLHDREDIFFLRLEEVKPVHLGQAEFDVRQTIASRRAEHEGNLAIDPPSVVVGRFDPEHFTPDAFDGEARVLTGVAVSPGVATGPARVVLRAGAEKILPGEILVAPFTDPGWTPYFMPAAGIAMDMGGLLSHGSIIAREYGIPAVVNVGPATRIIKTGQTIQVDGNRGVVRVLP